ncbi:hypothetical protein RQN30_12360 [Arcanobacterium hippocoleae]
MATFQRYLVLTPFAKANVLEKVLRIRKLAANVMRTDSGAVVYHDLLVKEYDDWDIAELLGAPAESKPNIAESEESAAAANSGDADAAAFVNSDAEFTAENSENPEFIAKVLSLLSPYGVILFTVELGDDIGGESGVSGIVHAQRVVNGKITEEIAPGLLLAVIDPQIEDLLIQPQISRIM